VTGELVRNRWKCNWKNEQSTWRRQTWEDVEDRCQRVREKEFVVRRIHNFEDPFNELKRKEG
jgi:hypothetical protein